MTEFQHKIIEMWGGTTIVVIVFVALCWFMVFVEQEQKEEALRWWIGEHYKIDIPDGYARHLNGIITTTDVQLSIDQFTVLEAK